MVLSYKYSIHKGMRSQIVVYHLIFIVGYVYIQVLYSYGM